mmetsp:Transcript_65536/g.147886  ORF Transcript_65536/g.147886 Transcript_65536/m.147886 type:complete len:112 (-) Transcript_65536:251-586(-)
MSTEALEGVGGLLCLDLRGNQIESTGDLGGLSACPQLSHLYLRFLAGSTPQEVAANPVCVDPSYRPAVAQAASETLAFLDGESIKSDNPPLYIERKEKRSFPTKQLARSLA